MRALVSTLVLALAIYAGSLAFLWSLTLRPSSQLAPTPLPLSQLATAPSQQLVGRIFVTSGAVQSTYKLGAVSAVQVGEDAHGQSRSITVLALFDPSPLPPVGDRLTLSVAAHSPGQFGDASLPILFFKLDPGWTVARAEVRP